jgi:hypothetical protein
MIKLLFQAFKRELWSRLRMMHIDNLITISSIHFNISCIMALLVRKEICMNVKSKNRLR